MTVIQQRGDLASVWALHNPVLAENELGWEEDTNFSKRGDGVTPWNELDYINTGGGTPGPVGPQGPQGPVGPAGPQGPQGVKGDTGNTGATGPAGAQGPQGVKGDTGDTGPAGAQGPAGPKGDTGDTGAQGPAGAAGATGPAGADGLTPSLRGTSTTNLPIGVGSRTFAINPAMNVPFPIGAQILVASDSNPSNRYMIGNVTAASPTSVTITVTSTAGSGNAHADWTLTLTGPRGLTGATGNTGATGPAGETGAQGPAGPQGPQGVKGDTGDIGPAGATGPAGAQGPQGVKGDTGNTGAQGPAGAAGADGLTPTLRGSSASPVAVGTGSKTFALTPSMNVAFPVGAVVRADAGANHLTGVVTAATVNSVTIDVTEAVGAGTPVGWLLVVAGFTGAQGAQGAQGPQGPAGASGITETTSGTLTPNANFSGSVVATKQGTLVTVTGAINRTGGYTNTAFADTGITLPVGMRPPATEILEPRTVWNATTNQFQYQVLTTGALQVRMLANSSNAMATNFSFSV